MSLLPNEIWGVFCVINFSAANGAHFSNNKFDIKSEGDREKTPPFVKKSMLSVSFAFSLF